MDSSSEKLFWYLKKKLVFKKKQKMGNKSATSSNIDQKPVSTTTTTVSNTAIPNNNSNEPTLPQFVTISNTLVPADNLLHVASYLDGSTLVRAFRTSKNMYHLFNSEHVWKTLCENCKFLAKPQQVSWKQYYFSMRILVIEFIGAYVHVLVVVTFDSSFLASTLKVELNVHNKCGKKLITPIVESSEQSHFILPFELQVPEHNAGMELNVKFQDWGDEEIAHSTSRIVMEAGQVDYVEHEIPLGNITEALQTVKKGDLHKCKICVKYVVDASGYQEDADFDCKFSNPETEYEWQGGTVVSINSLLVDWVAKTVQLSSK